jgi:hypothetical protein
MFALVGTNVARCSSEDERRFAEDVDLARQRCGFSHKQMALLMDLSDAQWSHQRAGREHISAFRLLKLGWHFELTLFTIRAARHGVEVLPPGALKDFFASVCAHLGVSRKDEAAA